MKKFTKYVMAPAVVATMSLQVVVPTTALANGDAAAVAVLPHGANSQFLSNLEAGAYDFSKIDKTQIQNLLNSRYFQQNEKDFRRANRLFNEFDAEFQQFLKNIIDGQLAPFTQKAVTGSPVTLQELAALGTDVKVARLSLETKITALIAMLDGLPGPTVAAGGEEIPAPVRFDLSQMANVFKNAIDEGINSLTQGQQIRVILRDREVEGCDPAEKIERTVSLSDAIQLNFGDNIPSLICDAELARMESQAKTYMKPTDADYDNLEEFGQFAHQEYILPYLDECGEEQGWRRTSGSETSSCEDMYRGIYQVFMVRSWIRSKYGIAIGAFGVEDYNERALSVDRLFTTTNAVREKLTGTIMFAGDDASVGGTGAMQVAEKSYNQYLDVARERASSLGFDEDIVSNINTLIRMSQTWTEDLAKVNMQILALLAQDTKQELDILRDNKGAKSRTAAFNARFFGEYLSDAEYGANYDFAYGKENDPTDKGFTGWFSADGGTGGLGTFGNTAGGLQGELLAIESTLNSLMDRFATARDIMVQVVAARSVGQRAAVRDEVDQRGDDQPPRRRRN